MVVAGLLTLVACGGAERVGVDAPTESSDPSVTVVDATGSTTATAPVEEPTTTSEHAAPAPSSSVPDGPGSPGSLGSLASVGGKVIVIDPGHNGGNYAHSADINRLVDVGTHKKECDTTGTATNDGYPEYEFTWDVADRLRAILQAHGATVVMTREGNDGWGPCITERAAIGNRAGADAALSIHADGGSAGGRGFHVLHPASIPGLTDDIATESERLAVAIRDEFAAGTGTTAADYLGSGGLMKRSDLGGLNLSDVPKVFIESGNMRNAEDAAFLSSPDGRQRMAEALAAGLAAYLAGG